MNILLTGATGFIGRQLSVELFKEGHQLTLVSRKTSNLPGALPFKQVRWDMAAEPCPISLEEFDAVIHLAGESVAQGRWTDERKRILRASRIDSTRHLMTAIGKRRQPLPLFIGASAIGYYPYGEAPADEEAKPGNHFLATLCQDWEQAMQSNHVVRSVVLRIGVVLGDGGGALEKMLLPTRLGLGGPLASGTQTISWIHLNDLLSIISNALKDPRYQGPINCVSPQVCSQGELSKGLATSLKRPHLLPTPAWILRLLFGEMADILLFSQVVVPRKLQKLGFNFRYKTLPAALQDVCNIHTKDNGRALACRRLTAVQFVPRKLPEVFPFFCDPYNLEKLTPSLLSFKIADVSTPHIQEGTLINYRLKVHGFPMRWRTRIEEWVEPQRFVDNQLKGPYAVWHHTHEFFDVPGGTLMTDKVKYRVPFGALGEVFALPLVRRDVREIFAFRQKIIGEIYAAKPADTKA